MKNTKTSTKGYSRGSNYLLTKQIPSNQDWWEIDHIGCETQILTRIQDFNKLMLQHTEIKPGRSWMKTSTLRASLCALSEKFFSGKPQWGCSPCKMWNTSKTRCYWQMGQRPPIDRELFCSNLLYAWNSNDSNLPVNADDAKKYTPSYTVSPAPSHQRVHPFQTSRRIFPSTKRTDPVIKKLRWHFKSLQGLIIHTNDDLQSGWPSKAAFEGNSTSWIQHTEAYGISRKTTICYIRIL